MERVKQSSSSNSSQTEGKMETTNNGHASMKPVNPKLKSSVESSTEKLLEPHPVKSFTSTAPSRDELAKILLRKPTMKDKERAERRNTKPNHGILKKKEEPNPRLVFKNDNKVTKNPGSNNNASIYLYTFQQEQKAELEDLEKGIEQIKQKLMNKLRQEDSLSLKVGSTRPKKSKSKQEKRSNPQQNLVTLPLLEDPNKNNLFEGESMQKQIQDNIRPTTYLVTSISPPGEKSLSKSITYKQLPEQSETTVEAESEAEYDDYSSSEYEGDDEDELFLKNSKNKEQEKEDVDLVKVKPPNVKFNSKPSISKSNRIKMVKKDNNYDPDYNSEEEDEKLVKLWTREQNKIAEQALEEKLRIQQLIQNKPRSFVLLWDPNLPLNPQNSCIQPQINCCCYYGQCCCCNYGFGKVF